MTTPGETIDFTVTFNEMNKKIIDVEIEEITKMITYKLLECLRTLPTYNIKYEQRNFSITRKSNGFFITDIKITSQQFTVGLGTNICNKLNEKLTAAGLINFQINYEQKYLGSIYPNITVCTMNTNNGYY